MRLALYGALVLLCLVLSGRWWLPTVLPGVLGQFGVVVASVERGSDGTLLVSGLEIESEGVRVGVDAVRLPNEVTYFWQVYAGEWTEASAVKIGAVTVELEEGESDTAGAAGEPMYFLELYRSVEEGLTLADRWVPPVRVDAVDLLRDAEALVSVADASFGARRLKGSVSVKGLAGPITVSAELGAEAPWALGLRNVAQALALDLEVEAVDDLVHVAGRVRQADSELALSADFGASHWLPLRARAASESFGIDPAWLPALEGIAWKRVELAGVDLNWEEGRYRGTLRAEAEVVSDALGPDKLTADLALSGDFEMLRVESLEVLASWVALSLSDPVSIDLRDGSVAEPAMVRGELDLAKQGFVEARGSVSARLSVAPSFAVGPDVAFELNASDLGFRDYAVDRAEISGRLRGDALSIEQMVLRPIAGGDALGITASGVADLASRELDFDYALLLPADWLNAQIGQAVLAGGLETEGQLGGSLDRPTIEGELAPLTLELPELVPVTLAGAYVLEGADRLSFSGTARAGEVVIETGVEVRVTGDTATVDLERFVWTDPVRSTLELQSPMRLSYQFAGESDVPEARLKVAPFVLSGPDIGIEGQWDPAEGLALSLSNVSVQRVGHWVQRELPEVRIESMVVSLSEFRPQVLGSLGFAAEGAFAGDGAHVRVELGALFTAEEAQVETLQLDFAGVPLVSGHLAAPVRLQIPEAGGRFWELLETGALEGTLSGGVNPGFVEWLAQNTGVRVSEAAVDLDLSGTLERPLGRLNLRVDSLKSPIAGLPALDRMELVAEGKAEAIEIEQLDFLINKSELSSAFQLPVDGFAEALRQGDADAWQDWLALGEGRLELIDWQAEDWVDILPVVMRRSGRLNGELELRPGWDIRGSLAFDNFALRPTASLPSVDSIGGQLELVDRRLSIRKASAQVGGNPVEVAGWVDAQEIENPLWEFTVSGRNVPLVRTTDMILRSDLDLKGARTDQETTPLISGTLGLRSSTLLAEIDPLAPNVEGGPQAQPPFFSINDPTVADWRFDLKIVGESFMRVRSPYFRTQLSANFDLGGTFAEPLLIGSVRTVGGELSFPGAKVRITSGEAFIEASQPNTVQLDFSGTAQKASQIISMRVTQTLDDPLVQFQSTPALSNAAIVRLLATGSASGGGAGAVGLYLGQGMLGAGGLDEQLSDRLTVDLGEEVSRSGRNTVGARYKISEVYSLEGGYDAYDAYNLDFIWSIFRQ